MSQPKYTLTYFNGRGRAEACRLLFAEAGVEYEDKRITKEEWEKLKPNAPFGKMPILEVTEPGKENIQLCQSIAIAMFLANRFGLAGKNDVEIARSHMVLQCVADMQDIMRNMMFSEDKEAAREKWIGGQRDECLAKFEKLIDDEFFVGNSMTVADIGFVCLASYMENPTSDFKFENCEFKKVAALMKKVPDSPGIKKWVNKRPETKF